ncbi:MAG: ATP-binding protein [Bacteroidota bacterium]
MNLNAWDDSTPLAGHPGALALRGKVIVLYGARQVGKTTLSRALLEPFGSSGLYLNCEIESVRSALSVREPMALKRYFGNPRIIVLDEAQRIPGVGEILKLLIDTYSDLPIQNWKSR